MFNYDFTKSSKFKIDQYFAAEQLQLFQVIEWLRKGNVFITVCQEFCPWGGGGGKEACVAGRHAWQGHAWWGMCMAGRACMIGGYAWQRGMRGRRDGHCTHPTGMQSCYFLSYHFAACNGSFIEVGCGLFLITSFSEHVET